MAGGAATCAAPAGRAVGNAGLANATDCDGDRTVVRTAGFEAPGARGATPGTCTTSVSVGTNRGGVLGGSAISPLSTPDHGG